MTGVRVDVVVPTLGRASLPRLLASLAESRGPTPCRVILVDDRPAKTTPLLADPLPERLRLRVRVVAGAARGPAAARNTGWRVATEDWVAFLDDDVTVERDWLQRLADDLAPLDDDVAASEGRIWVPRDSDHAPTDWERNVAGLERARYATADMTYRRRVLAVVGGFDERFPRAYREDADLALRVLGAGFRIVRGSRRVLHPVRPASPAVSLRLQRGNADDVLMRAVHGPTWRERAFVPAGRRPRHLAIVAAAAGAVLGALTGRRRLAALGAAAWAIGTAELAWARIAPGPRDRDEVRAMIATSLALPFAATAYALAGVARLPGLLAAGGPRPLSCDAAEARPDAVLFDRDGTLVVNVPYNGDPARALALPGARDALERLRAAGVRLGVVTNQAAVGRGVIALHDVHAVNRRIEDALGPLGPWMICPHRPEDGCACRKPAPGLVLSAASALGVTPARCVVIGDTAADVQAAHTAGARGILVPNEATRPEEIAQAPEVATDLGAAVDRILGAPRPSASARVETMA